MAKLNFKTLIMPTLDLEMSDENDTFIQVTTPTEGLVEELEQMRENVTTIFGEANPNAIDACYDLAARLISCNRQGLQVSVDELKTKYWPKNKEFNQIHLLAFFKSYTEYVDELKNLKN